MCDKLLTGIIARFYALEMKAHNHKFNANDDFSKGYFSGKAEAFNLCARVLIQAYDKNSEHELVELRSSSEAVRCRDCQEYKPELYNHISCELLGRYVEPNGFCAWGERKSDTEKDKKLL